MTLPASGSISMSAIRGEFGGSAPDSLTEYYRGGSFVPNIAANSAIPTSGSIAFSNFYGGQGLGTLRHSTTITAGSAAPLTGYSASVIGSIASAFYNDGGGNSRGINTVMHSTASGLVTFRIAGTSVPNTDVTFTFIRVNGVLYQRSAATYTASGPGTTTQWTWSSSNPFGANPNPLLVYSS